MFIKAIEAACDEVSAEVSADVSAETPNVKFRPRSSIRKADALGVMAGSISP